MDDYYLYSEIYIDKHEPNKPFIIVEPYTAIKLLVDSIIVDYEINNLTNLINNYFKDILNINLFFIKNIRNIYFSKPNHLQNLDEYKKIITETILKFYINISIQELGSFTDIMDDYFNDERIMDSFLIETIHFISNYYLSSNETEKKDYCKYLYYYIKLNNYCKIFTKSVYDNSSAITCFDEIRFLYLNDNLCKLGEPPIFYESYNRDIIKYIYYGNSKNISMPIIDIKMSPQLFSRLKTDIVAVPYENYESLYENSINKAYQIYGLEQCNFNDMVDFQSAQKYLLYRDLLINLSLSELINECRDYACFIQTPFNSESDHSFGGDISNELNSKYPKKMLINRILYEYMKHNKKNINGVLKNIHKELKDLYHLSSEKNIDSIKHKIKILNPTNPYHKKCKNRLIQMQYLLEIKPLFEIEIINSDILLEREAYLANLFNDNIKNIQSNHTESNQNNTDEFVKKIQKTQHKRRQTLKKYKRKNFNKTLKNKISKNRKKTIQK